MSGNPRSKLLFAAGALALGAAAAGIVVLAAATTWWALFGLLALWPVMMLVCGAAMIGATGGRIGRGSCSAGPCAAWLGRPSRSTIWTD